MEIHPVAVTASRGRVTARSRIVTASGEQDLWFELDEAHAPHLVRDRLDEAAPAASGGRPRGVGTGDGTSCSACLKCCRTLATLEVLGELERFEKVFDLVRCQKVRTSYVRRALLADADGPFGQEIRDAYDAAGCRFPVSDPVGGALLRLRRRRAHS